MIEGKERREGILNITSEEVNVNLDSCKHDPSPSRTAALQIWSKKYPIASMCLP